MPLSPKNFSRASFQSLAIAEIAKSLISGKRSACLARISGFSGRYPSWAMVSCAASV
jgi:hypothetical protein